MVRENSLKNLSYFLMGYGTNREFGVGPRTGNRLRRSNTDKDMCVVCPVQRKVDCIDSNAWMTLGKCWFLFPLQLEASEMCSGCPVCVFFSNLSSNLKYSQQKEFFELWGNHFSCESFNCQISLSCSLQQCDKDNKTKKSGKFFAFLWKDVALRHAGLQMA